MRIRSVAGFAFSLLIACGPTSADVRELERHRDAWEALGTSSYTFRYRIDCFCPNAMTLWRVEVRGGRPVRADQLHPSPADAVNPMPTNEHLTVDSLFALIADAYERNADQVQVRYDSKYHYPIEIRIDWVTFAIDDEMSVIAEGLAPKPAS